MVVQWLLKKPDQKPNFFQKQNKTSVIERRQKFFIYDKMILIKGLFKSSGIFNKLVQLIVAFLFFSLLSLAAWQIFTDNDYSNIKSLKLLQLFQSVGMFILPPIVLAFLWSEKPFNYLQLNTSVRWTDSIKVVLVMLAAIPAINLLSSINQQVVLPDFLHSFEEWMKNSEVEKAVMTKKFVNVDHLTGLIFNLFLIAMIPALGEELFFRGIIQKIFTEWKSAIPAIWLSAIIFSTIHFQFYGFIPRMLLGAFFGYILFWSGSLWLTIIAHFINNAIAVVFYYLKFNGFNVFDIDTIGTGNTIWIGILSCLVCILMLWKIKVHFKKSI